MKRFPVLTLVVFFALSASALFASVAHCDVVQVERLILLPNGKPAVGAKVLLRSLHKEDGTLKQEVRLVTDDKGMAQGEIAFDSDEARSGLRTLGYMMVDMPGMALTFEDFAVWYRWKPDLVQPLKLSDGHVLAGQVHTGQKKPVAGAQVVLAAFASGWANWRINYPAAGIVTSELITTSDAAGNFQLRSVDISARSSAEAVVRPLLMAHATVNGTGHAGSIEFFARNTGASNQQIGTQNTIRLDPTSTVRGRITSILDNKPIAGATVTLRADPGDQVYATLRPAVSGADGTYSFSEVPQQFQLFAEVTHPNFAKGWTRIGQERNRIGHSPLNNDPSGVYEEANVGLRPWAEISGKILDIKTTAPPLTPISIQAIYEEGHNDGRIAVGRGVAVGQMQADGTFAMQMPVGYNHVRVRGPGYWEGGAESPIDLEVAAQGQKDLIFKVRREKGYLTRFITAAAEREGFNFDQEFDVHMRDKSGKTVGTNAGLLWYWPLYKPDDTLEIRVTKFVDGYAQEVLPWTKLVSGQDDDSPANWPRQIHLSSRQTLTVRGKVVAAETHKPLSGVSVKLVSRPEKAAQSIAPVESREDGSFVFEHVPLPVEMLLKASPDKNNPTHAGLQVSWARVGEGEFSAVASLGDEGNQQIDGLSVPLAPLREVNGQVLDVETNQPPLVSLSPISIAFYPQGNVVPLSAPPDTPHSNRPLRPDLKSFSVKTEPDGSFSARLPVGLTRLSHDWHYEIITEDSILSIPAPGLEDAIIKVRRKPQLVFEFNREGMPVPYNVRLYVVKPDSKYGDTLVATAGFADSKVNRLHWNVPEWGHRIRLRAVDQKTKSEIFNQEFVAERDQWLYKFGLPKATE